MPVRSRALPMRFVAVLVSAALAGFYARGDAFWPFGFIVLVPWLLALDGIRQVRHALIAGVAMAIGFQAAALYWFGVAFGAYVGLSSPVAIVILLALAPILQPQFAVFAWARVWSGRHHGSALRTLAAASAWVACEWLWPKLLGDTLGHGLYPSITLRQAADLAGASGLTFALLLVNEAVAHTLRAWRAHRRESVFAAAMALTVVLTLAGYGHWRLSQLKSIYAAPAAALRVGLIQSNITDLERRRREQGTFAAVQQTLQTHAAMSEFAVREQGADALLWSETVYPTTFGNPKSADGAAFDRDLQAFVEAIGVPLVFGTYDRDAAGEYNSAAFLDPARGLLGHYRKTYPFPFTERVPAWLDVPSLRRALPWTGQWQAGTGARVFPVRSRDGRESNVMPLICLDDVHPQLAIDGARLGAEAILGLSNDSWFTAHPIGARLHLTVAAFRSIETRLPQLRATANGMSAIIDETGEIVARTDMGQQAVLVGEIPLRTPVPTVMVRLGDWVGVAGVAFWLALLGRVLVQTMLRRRRDMQTAAVPEAGPIDVVLLPRALWFLDTLLNGAAAMSLVWLFWRMATIDGFQVNNLLLVRAFVFGVATPLLVAWMMRRLHGAVAHVEGEDWIVESARHRIALPIARIVRSSMRWHVGGWASIELHLASGARFPMVVLTRHPRALDDRLASAGVRSDAPRSRWAEFVVQRTEVRHRLLDHGAVRFVLFPLLLALPAFRLHQHIAFGGTFGEWQTYGFAAWLTGLLIWWVAWSLGLMLVAAVLRIVAESLVAAVFVLSPARSATLRFALTVLMHALYYLGIPVWFAIRLVWG